MGLPYSHMGHRHNSLQIATCLHLVWSACRRCLLAGTACVPASDGRAQLRCMRMSPDCRHIIIGDFRGNLRVYDSVTLKPTIVHEAHDDEILCLDYSPVGAGGRSLAASGSRDTLIHIYDVQSGYELVETLDDHSAAVTAVRFTGGGRGLVSCGADRSIIFRYTRWKRLSSCLSGRTTMARCCVPSAISSTAEYGIQV